MKTRTILTFLSLVIFTVSIHAQRSVDNIFRKYKNDSGVMYMDMGGNFAQFLKGEEGENIKSSVDQVKLMLFNKGNNMSDSDLDDLKEALGAGDYEMLIQVNDEEVKLKLYVIDGGDYFTEIFGMVKSKDYNVFARLYGKIYYEDISKLDMDMGNAGNFGELFGK